MSLVWDKEIPKRPKVSKLGVTPLGLYLCS